ncbi:hypothetical protein BDV28DRAFT_133467 [Aspergillus coremiiformis]|uniref:Uncharacterized protein n=1 Tax=Aspergillus coremiiformis TaxID=138285 RepID=A0A5N6Z6D8_9EURO|nr:hypothetical protein BDV28DRAFT_133467 [Aspergillus coremiiformis]
MISRFNGQFHHPIMCFPPPDGDTPAKFNHLAPVMIRAIVVEIIGIVLRGILIPLTLPTVPVFHL